MTIPVKKTVDRLDVMGDAIGGVIIEEAPLLAHPSMPVELLVQLVEEQRLPFVGHIRTPKWIERSSRPRRPESKEISHRRESEVWRMAAHSLPTWHR